MDRVFKSKVGWWYHLVVLLMAGICFKQFLGTDVITMVASAAAVMLLLHILFNTWYKITEEGILVVHFSIFPEKRIAISEISAVEVSALPVSSPALSLDRLIIYKGERQWLMVSPVNKKEFVALLRKYNPDIRIKETII